MGKRKHVPRTWAFAWDGFKCSTSFHELWTRCTHWGGFMSRTVRAGFGNKYLVSFIVGMWSRSAALCSSAATLPMSYCEIQTRFKLELKPYFYYYCITTQSWGICSPGMTSSTPSR